MADDNNPPATVPPGPGTSPEAGTGNVSTPPAAPANTGMSLEDLNAITGRTYKSLEEAKAGVGETYKFVGARATATPPGNTPPTPPAPVPKDSVSREEFESALFFRDNPEYNANRALLENIAKANGVTVQQAAATDFYKETAAKLKAADEASNTRSALTSNPRLGTIRDSSAKAMEAFENSQKARASGDTVAAERLQRQAEGDALSAVIGAFKMENDSIVP